MSLAPKITIGAHLRFKCNTCKTDTNHELKALHQRHWEEEYEEGDPHGAQPYYEIYEYRFWVCLGCDTATLQEVWAPMGDIKQSSSTFYPRRLGRKRSYKEFRQLERKLQTAYREVVNSFNNGLRFVCAIGMRALLEGICVNRGITDKDAWGLEDKLGKLEENKHLPSNIVECLLSFKFIGDDAAHRLEAPPLEQLELALDVMEDLLNFLYEAEYQLASRAKKLADQHASRIVELKNRRASRKKS